jgi:hypothetical protein
LGDPTPWQVAARSFTNAQVLGNYAVVLRKVTRHGGESSGGEPRVPNVMSCLDQGGCTIPGPVILLLKEVCCIRS